MDPFVEVYHQYVYRQGIGQVTSQVRVDGVLNITRRPMGLPGIDLGHDGRLDPQAAWARGVYLLARLLGKKPPRERPKESKSDKPKGTENPTQVQTPETAQGLGGLFGDERTPTASDLMEYAEQQGWEPVQTETGPLHYVDRNGIRRMTIKRGSPRAPGSGHPHVELRNASGQRIDPYGNPVTRKDPRNHTPIVYDL